MDTNVQTIHEIRNRFSIRFGGIAGDGLQSTGILFQKYLNKLGYFVKGFPGTQSTIRGGHVWQHVELSAEKFDSYDQIVDVLVAFRNVCLDVHLRDVKSNGLVIYNENTVKLDDYHDEIKDRSIITLGIPMSNMARNIDPRKRVLVNTIAIGSLIYVLNLEMEKYLEVLAKRFLNSVSVLEMNSAALNEGYAFLKTQNSLKYNLELPQGKSNRIVISGNEMIALGAVASGLKFLAQYPITPASSILTYLSNRARKLGIIVRQAEDELAAISMIIGASYAGVRSMTASSGPGISLMSEAFGYASMTETPIVIVNAMRAGPSTGVPTKMEQGDLASSIYLSHGESPRIILAPRNMEECFDITVRAFNLADYYQVPVIILSDFALSERTESIEEFPLDVEIERGNIWKGPTAAFPEFKRHGLTESGISPRAFPPTKKAMYIAVGAEHDESSHSLSGNRCGLPSSGILREQMFHKRFKKLENIRKILNEPEMYGEKNADYTILCWGSTQGAVKEVVDIMNLNDEKWNMLSFSDLFPLPFDKIRTLLEKINYGIMFEVNYTGQFENLLYNHLGWKPNASIRPLTGENPTPFSIMKELENIIQRRNLKL